MSVKKNKNASPKSPRIVKPVRTLDGDFVEVLEALERGEVFPRIPRYDEFLEESKTAARNYFKKDARVSFRLSRTDLNNIKRMAAEEGLPYQTFLASMIHKLTTGRLVQKP